MVGKTEQSFAGLLPPHYHDLEVVFTDKGVIVPTETSIVMNHSHRVAKATATESVLDHSHRLILM